MSHTKLLNFLLRFQQFRSIAIILLFLVIACVPWQYFYQSEIDLLNALKPPTIAHLFGTDNLGRDLLVRLAETIHNTVMPIWIIIAIGGVASTIFNSIFIALSERLALVKTLTTAYQTLSTVILAIPFGILVFFLVSFLSENNLLTLALAYLLFIVLNNFLLLFNLYISDQKLEYWLANKAMAGKPLQRIWRHGILTNWRHQILQSFYFHLSFAIVVETTLSYLGFGVAEPRPSFGNILASHLDLYLKGHWLSLAFILIVFYIASSFPYHLAGLFRANVLEGSSAEPIARSRN